MMSKRRIMMKKRAIKRRRVAIKRRRTITLLAVAVIMITTMLNLAWAREKDSVSVVVRNGDTVWSIAEEHNPDNKDLRELVHEIIKENNLQDGTIYAGQELIIPIN